MNKPIVLSLALAAVAAAQAPQGQQPASFAGVVRLNKAPVSNEVLKAKLPRPVEPKAFPVSPMLPPPLSAWAPRPVARKTSPKPLPTSARPSRLAPVRTMRPFR
jgi:hypothetical protein